ncbi:Rho-GTPase-activating protein 8 [Microbotryomycetes sp. JL221]|nr:Rho-GTPase-activating protein 8 [Microbotryomycetes sp. JL221]
MSESARPRSTSVATPATITLPLTFSNSFWSHDYRTGVERLYSSLDAGIVASSEVVDLVRLRASAERAFARAITPRALSQDGFAQSDASLRVSFEAVLTGQLGEARARSSLADDLVRSIADPFEQWSQTHEGRIKSSRSFVETHLTAWEKGHANTLKLKSQYDDACRLADQVEDELSHTTRPQQDHRVDSNPVIQTSPLRPSSAVDDSQKTRTMKSEHQSSTANGQDQDDDVKSEDGGNRDQDDDDDTIIPRSGLVGGAGAITSALGRAFSVKRASNDQQTRSRAGSNVESTNYKNMIESPISPDVGAAFDWSRTKFNSILERVAGPQSGEGRFERAKKHAEEAEQRYKSSVLSLDNLRLVLEEAIAEHLSYAQRCEADRMKAVASVLRSLHVAVSALPKLVAGSLERINVTLELSTPSKDIAAIIEQQRTGPFSPRPVVFQSHWSEPYEQRFGIDLRKFSETSNETVPPVLSFLLDHIATSYSKVSDSEKRKVWIYETPLTAQHHLRQALNMYSTELDTSMLQPYDLPVIASTVKLWLLELEVPPILYTQYDEFKQLYPVRVGSEVFEVPVKAIADHVSRLPPVHLAVLRLVIEHFARLIDETKTDETDEVYLQKLSLSLARCVVRPRFETAISLDDRFPTLLFADLVRHHTVIFSSADQLKSGRDDRYKPRRQRTRPMDARLSRSSMGVSANESIDRETADALLREQHKAKATSTSPAFTDQVQSPITASKSVSTGGEAVVETENGGRRRDSTGDTPTTSSKLPEASAKSIDSTVDAATVEPATVSAEVPQPPSFPDPRASTSRGARGPRPLPQPTEAKEA